MADIFGDQPINDDVTVDVLVGDGKKYSDVNNLAKAYVNVENFAEELKRENAILRAKQDAKDLNAPEPNSQQPPQNANDQGAPAEPVKAQVNEKDLRTLVSEQLQELDTVRKFENNVETTAQKMVEVYGSAAKAQEALAQKARELGVGIEWLRDAAARSPQAFYATMGIPDSPPSSASTPAPKNELRIEQKNLNSGRKDYSYFQDLRRTNKSLYYSAGVQNEMQRLAREQGDAFYT